MNIENETAEKRWAWLCSCGNASRGRYAEKRYARQKGREHRERVECGGTLSIADVSLREERKRWAKKSLGM